MIQISAKGNLDRVRDEAARLGMLPPAAGQVRMISLPAGFGEATVAQAAEAPDDEPWTEDAVRAALQARLDAGESRSAAARAVAEQAGWNRRDVYNLDLD